eukprot:6211988-Pleurochrysis_carterae.AAC.2
MSGQIKAHVMACRLSLLHAYMYGSMFCFLRSIAADNSTHATLALRRTSIGDVAAAKLQLVPHPSSGIPVLTVSKHQRINATPTVAMWGPTDASDQTRIKGQHALLGVMAKQHYRTKS